MDFNKPLPYFDGDNGLKTLSMELKRNFTNVIRKNYALEQKRDY